jgi:hypothetical protein
MKSASCPHFSRGQRVQEDVFVIVGKLSDDGSGKTQGQVAEQGLLLFERKVTQCLSRLERSGSLQQSHSLIPMGLRNRVPKPLSNW